MSAGIRSSQGNKCSEERWFGNILLILCPSHPHIYTLPNYVRNAMSCIPGPCFNMRCNCNNKSFVSHQISKILSNSAEHSEETDGRTDKEICEGRFAPKKWWHTWGLCLLRILPKSISGCYCVAVMSKFYLYSCLLISALISIYHLLSIILTIYLFLYIYPISLCYLSTFLFLSSIYRDN